MIICHLHISKTNVCKLECITYVNNVKYSVGVYMYV